MLKRSNDNIMKMEISKWSVISCNRSDFIYFQYKMDDEILKRVEIFI